LKLSQLPALCFKNGKKVLLCGNGGSAADSQHIATEFVIRLNPKIKRPGLPAIAITTDTSNLTAGGNDIGFENTFARTVKHSEMRVMC
jgi:D-sedoheptulose 7-phosphate isomerase